MTMNCTRAILDLARCPLIPQHDVSLTSPPSRNHNLPFHIPPYLPCLANRRPPMPQEAIKRRQICSTFSHTRLCANASLLLDVEQSAIRGWVKSQTPQKLPRQNQPLSLTVRR